MALVHLAAAKDPLLGLGHLLGVGVVHPLVGLLAQCLAAIVVLHKDAEDRPGRRQERPVRGHRDGVAGLGAQQHQGDVDVQRAGQQADDRLVLANSVAAGEQLQEPFAQADETVDRDRLVLAVDHQVRQAGALDDLLVFLFVTQFGRVVGFGRPRRRDDCPCAGLVGAGHAAAGRRRFGRLALCAGAGSLGFGRTGQREDAQDEKSARQQGDKRTARVCLHRVPLTLTLTALAGIL